MTAGTRRHAPKARPHPLAVALAGGAVLVLADLLRRVLGADLAATAATVETVGAAVLLGGVAVAVYPLTPRGRVRGFYGPGGWAGRRQLHQSLSARAVRRTGATVRPGLSELPAEQRRNLAATEYGAALGRTVVGPVVPWRIYASYRDVVLAIAPPQTGKTAWLGGAIIDAPGAVVATSTKADIHLHTAELRAQRGPVHVFNPEQVGDLGSTLRWSPVAGCQDPARAAEHAGYLIDGAKPAAGVSDGAFFEQQAAKVLRAFLLAAALDGRGMATVAEWVQDPGDRAPLRILDEHSDRVPPSWAGELAQVLDTSANRTRESIYLTLGLATAFMADPEVAAMCSPDDDGAAFDVEALVRDRGTLYLLGSDRAHAAIAPLLSCLTGHIFETCKRLAADRPGGRLDPPVMLALDEAALITPVPLDRWTADSGGRGLQLVIAVQSPSQLFQRWGERGGQTILNNANVKLYYGGLTLTADLEAMSVLCGTREEPTVSDTVGDGRRSTSTGTQLVRTVPPDRLRQLPRWHVLVLYRDAPPTIGRVTPVWTRRDVRAARRAS
jgi:type IV secretion system protein VirD4